MALKMFKAIVIVAAIAIGSCLTANAADLTDQEMDSLKKTLPKEVQKIADRMEGCAHWSGEPPFDANRRAEIEKNLKTLRCGELRSDEARVLKKFEAKKDSIKKVFEYSKIGPG